MMRINEPKATGSNRYYDEWDMPRAAVLLRDVIYLTVKDDWSDHSPRTDYWARAGERVWIQGRMTEDTRPMYGDRWLHNADIRGFGSLVEGGVDFEFTNEEES